MITLLLLATPACRRRAPEASRVAGVQLIARLSIPPDNAVSAATLLPGGGAAIVDATTRVVMRFDSSGRLTGRFSATGGAAGGPHRIDFLGALGSGDLVAFDVGAQQLVHLDTLGTRRSAIDLPVLDGATWPAVTGMTPGGALVFRGRAFAPPGLPDGVYADSDRMYVVDPATARLSGSWGPLPSFRYHVVHGYAFTLPFEPARSQSVVDSFTAWTWGASDTIALDDLAGHAQRVLHATFPPRAVPSSEPGVLRSRATERRGMMGSRAAYTQALRETPLPGRAPFITAMIGMPPGELLVRGWTPAESASVTWQRLSIADSVLGEFILPATARILAARNGRILVADIQRDRLNLSVYRFGEGVDTSGRVP